MIATDEGFMAELTCPNCAGDMEQVEKTTFTGRDMREYKCPQCGRTEIIDHGIALWQALSDAAKTEDEKL